MADVAKSSVNKQLCRAIMLLPFVCRSVVRLLRVRYAAMIALGRMGADNYSTVADKGLDRYVMLW